MALLTDWHLGTYLNGAPAVSVFAWIQLDSTEAISNSNNRICSFIINGTSVGLVMNIDVVTVPGSIRLAVSGRSMAGDGFQGVVSQVALAADGTTWYAVGGWLDFTSKQAKNFVGATGNLVGSKTWGANVWTHGVPSIPDSIGCLFGSTVDSWFDGRIAHLAVWKAKLTDDEFVALSLGVAPSDIRPDSLMIYSPLLGLHDPEIDYSPNNLLWSIEGSVPLATGDAPLSTGQAEESGFEGFTSGATAIYDDAVTIATALGMATTGGYVSEGTISLPTTVGVETIVSTTLSEGIFLPMVVTANLVGSNDINTIISLSTILGFNLPEEGSGQQWEDTIALGAVLGMVPLDIASVSDIISLDATMEFTPSFSGSVYDEQIAFAMISDIGIEVPGSTYDASAVMEVFCSFTLEGVVSGDEIAPTAEIRRRRRG